jgi:hypothetical protein
LTLPFAERAAIDPRKLTEYLLSTSDLQEVARSGLVTETVTTPFGTKYVVDGRVTTPSGRELVLRTVWMIASNEEVPRFVTAYPRLALE